MATGDSINLDEDEEATVYEISDQEVIDLEENSNKNGE